MDEMFVSFSIRLLHLATLSVFVYQIELRVLFLSLSGVEDSGEAKVEKKKLSR